LLPKQPLEYDRFFNHWNTPDILFSKLQAQTSGFGRGLPQVFSGISVSCLNLLREIISDGKISVVDLDKAPNLSNGKERERAEEAQKVIKSGWVYVSSDVTDDNPSVIMEFASPLHCAWFSSRLQRDKPLPPTFSDSNLDMTWKEVLRNFSVAAFRNPIRTPVSSRNTTFVESQYQQEFYRSLYSLTDGACCVSPEYGGQTSSEKKGRIDFFIGSKGWGIELLQDGDRIPGHISRFRAGGAYHPWLASGYMKEYVILDFRQTKPSESSSTCFLILCSPLTENCIQMWTAFSMLSTMGTSRVIRSMTAAYNLLVILLDCLFHLVLSSRFGL
jgi:hypothetical protein